MTTTPAESTPIDTTAPIQRSVPTKRSMSAKTSLSAGRPAITPNSSDPRDVETKTEELAGERRREAAIRALAEAAERHGASGLDGRAKPEKGERSGRGGLDPVRYGDWEVKGIATDF
jgi:hypothetical protein